MDGISASEEDITQIKSMTNSKLIYVCVYYVNVFVFID